MRVFKGIVGWLCFLSLVASISFMGYWLYLIAAPWFRGAALHRLPQPDPAEITEKLAAGGIDSSDSEMLREYVHQKVDPVETLTGWDALLATISNFGAVTTSRERNNVAAAALVEQSGRVVAAYPGPLVGRYFGFSIPISQVSDSRYGRSARYRYPVWSGSFARVARMHAPDVGEVYMNRVVSPDGKTLAILATAARNRRLVASGGGHYSRSEAEQARAVAILTFMLYWLLLPAWMAIDAGWRGMRPFAWGVLGLVTNLIGLGGYLIARLPAPSTCLNCGERLLGRYVRCPACGLSLRQTMCPVCRTPMKPGWQYCPACSGIRLQPTPQTEMPFAAQRPEAPTQANLQVGIRDAGSGAPVPNARIVIKGPSGLEGLTGRNGIFQAKRLRSGNYTVTATKHGYEPAEAELDISEQSPEAVQLSLRALPGKIVGRAVERVSRKPVAGVSIYLDSSRLDRAVQTGADGRFALADIPAGPYTVRSEAEGFAAQTKLAELLPGQQVTVDFALEPSPEPSEAEHSQSKEDSDDTE